MPINSTTKRRLYIPSYAFFNLVSPQSAVPFQVYGPNHLLPRVVRSKFHTFFCPNLGTLMRAVITIVIDASTAAIINVARNESAYASTTCSRYSGGSSTIACTDLRTF